MLRRYRAIGVDFDGTLTSEGPPSADVLASLREAREDGLRLVLVTGRILAELSNVFPGAEDCFDCIVAENGAVLARPAGLRRLAPPIPLELDEAFRKRAVPFRRGQVLLATVMSSAPIVWEELSRLGLECQIVQNRGELMVVPAGVTKGTGLAAALAELGISPHAAVGIGDAENDHSLLNLCELGVAVANAVPSLKAHADLVLAEPAGRGVADFLRGPLLRGEEEICSPRWLIEVGRFDDGAPVCIPADGVNVLIEGATLSGKSYAAGLLAEGLLVLGYSICVLDPEGDHMGLGGLHACMTVGGKRPLPSPEQLGDLLRSTFGSLVVDLSLLPRPGRVATSASMLDALQRERERSGFPHWILLDEAHVPLGAEGPACSLYRPEQKGFCLVTYQPERLCARARQGLDVVITAVGDGHATLRERGVPGPARPFVLGDRITGHVRHRSKYVHAELPWDRRFYFRDPAQTTWHSAGNLEQFHHELRRCSLAGVEHHVAGHDFSRWVDDVLQDAELAARLREIEAESRASGGTLPAERLRAALRDAVQQRYRLM